MTTTPTPRPVPTTEDRMRDARTDHLDVANKRDYPTSFATYLDRTERDQLDAKAACAQQERDEALQDRDVLRAQLDEARRTITAQTAQLRANRTLLDRLRELGELTDRAWAEHDTNADREYAALSHRDAVCPTCHLLKIDHIDGPCQTRAALRDVLAELKDRTAELGAAQQLADFRQGVNDSLRQDLSDVGDVIAAVREAAERLDRALAGRLPSLPDIRAAVEHIDRALAAYDTTPESTASAPALGSPPPRAQDEPDSDARRLLDQAIDTGLPLAGGRVAKLLDALRRELVRVDAKRAVKAEG